MIVFCMVIVVYDEEFYEEFFMLFFYVDVKSWFILSLEVVYEIVMCNSFM